MSERYIFSAKKQKERKKKSTKSKEAKRKVQKYTMIGGHNGRKTTKAPHKSYGHVNMHFNDYWSYIKMCRIHFEIAWKLKQLRVFVFLFCFFVGLVGLYQNCTHFIKVKKSTPSVTDLVGCCEFNANVLMPYAETNVHRECERENVRCVRAIKHFEWLQTAMHMNIGPIQRNRCVENRWIYAFKAIIHPNQNSPMLVFKWLTGNWRQTSTLNFSCSVGYSSWMTLL